MPSAPRTAYLVRLTIALIIITAGMVTPASTSTLERPTNPIQGHSREISPARPLAATPIVQSNGQVVFPQSVSQNHWWLLDFWDNATGANLPTNLTGQFVAIPNTISGLQQPSDAILYLPLNIAYGTSTTNCVWFQFDVNFDPYGGVEWYIWDVNCPGSLNSDYHYTPVGLHYTVGDNYSFAIKTSGKTTVTFSINDTTAGTYWSESSWVWKIVSTNIVATDTTFSPSSSVEGYTTTSSLTGVPTFQTKMGGGITTNRYYESLTGEPGGARTFRSKLDSSHWMWEMTTLACGPETGPDNLNCIGISPTAIVLNWGQSHFSASCFVGYVVQRSSTTADGPWSTILTNAETNTTAVVQNLLPGKTYWWREVDQANSLCFNESVTSNSLQAAQPNTTLSYKPLSDTNYRFTWNNLADYNGPVGFSSYILEESINNSSYSIIYSSTSVTTTALNQTLAPATIYTIYLITADKCSTCPSPWVSNSTSNTISFQTVATLQVSISIQPASLDLGQIVSFTCSAIGGSQPYNYTWTFGDGQTASGRTVSHYYTQTGTDIAYCSVVDNLRDTALKTLPITIFSDPTVSLIADRTSVDIGQTYALTAQASGGSGGYRYAWANVPPNCATRTGAITLLCQATTANTYQIVVSATDSNSYTVRSNPLNITILPDPIITRFTASKSSLDVDQTLNFTTIAIQGAGPLSYAYTGLPSGCTTSNQNILTCNPTSAGTFNIKVTVTDSNNYAVVSNSFQLTVNPSPAGNINASPSTDLSLGQTLTLSVTVTNGVGPFTYSYTDLPPGCPSSNSSSITCTPAVAGSWLVTASITDRAGETDNATVAVDVFEPYHAASLSDTEITAIGGIAVLAATGTVVLVLRVRNRKTKQSPRQ